MYRARVEAISGAKIFAGGKWLQCIGNKTFRVGELAWTDGRCAYGNHYTPQQPLVITAPKVDGEAIPILMYNFIVNDLARIYQDYENLKTSYYTFYLKQGLKQVEGKEQLLLEADIPQGSGTSTRERENQVFLINGKQAPAFIQPFEWRYEQAYKSYENGESPQRWTFPLAFNIGREGNTYELRAILTEEWLNWLPFPDGSRHFLKHTKVQLIKNKEIIQEFEFWELLAEAVTEATNIACSYITNLSRVEYDYSCNVALWGNIEHDNDWAFIVTTTGRATVYAQKLRPRDIANRADANSHALYLYTPHGVKRFAHIAIESDDIQHFDYHVIEKEDDETDLLLPIQDGYYYKVNKLIRRNETSASPAMTNITIYSPDDTELCTGTCVLGTYFTICKIAADRYLLGVCNRENLFRAPLNEINTDTNQINIDSGLYLIKDKQLKKIAEGYVLNWKFRPMKSATIWQKRLKAMEM